MKSKAIVTLADSNYFELLLELIASIKKYMERFTLSQNVLRKDWMFMKNIQLYIKKYIFIIKEIK